MESELFGDERGAFTGATTRKNGLLELARTGTVLLDEIAELSLALQAKLLRVLEERVARRVGGVDEVQIRCRVIAATNESLEAAVGRGAFREDLYYRLNAFRLVVPPLRERIADVEILARHFLQEIAVDQRQTPVSISPEACAVLRSHEWRGNVRELKHVIERAAVVCDGAEIQPHHIVLHRRSTTRDPGAPASTGGEIRIPRTGMTMDEIEREAIRITLEYTGGNQTIAARTLGISRATLLRKLEKFGLKDGVSTVVVA
jgi:DNA-binding NtrC family response regulator